MLTFIRCIALSGAIMVLFSQTPVQSGEFAGRAGACSLSGSAVGACTWTSAKCTRPTPPMLYSGSAAELNRSADTLNGFVSDLNAYMKCVSDEGQGDAKASVDVIQAGINQLQKDATADFDKLKSQYEADRLRLQTQQPR